MEIETNMETKHSHLVSDLSIAAYLLAKGYRLEGLELLGSRYAFRFADDGSVTQAVLEFTKGGMVEAVIFAEAIKQLKNALYSEKFRNGNGAHGQQYPRR
jgi:hypothetical protein